MLGKMFIHSFTYQNITLASLYLDTGFKNHQIFAKAILYNYAMFQPDRKYVKSPQGTGFEMNFTTGG